MKRITFFLLSVFGLISIATAQDSSTEKTEKNTISVRGTRRLSSKSKIPVISDKVDGDGNRFLKGEFIAGETAMSMFNPEKNHNVALAIGADVFNGEVNYSLYFLMKSGSTLSIEEGSPILIKFGDDSVFTSKCALSSSDKIGNSYYVMGVSGRNYTITSFMPLTDELVAGLENGLKKMRFEVNHNVYDVTFTRDVLSKKLLAQLDEIQRLLEKERKFSDDF